MSDTVTITVSYIDLLALKKLALVSGALATKFSDSPRAKDEMDLLNRTLLDVINKIDVAKASLT